MRTRDTAHIVQTYKESIPLARKLNIAATQNQRTRRCYVTACSHRCSSVINNKRRSAARYRHSLHWNLSTTDEEQWDHSANVNQQQSPTSIGLMPADTSLFTVFSLLISVPQWNNSRYNCHIHHAGDASLARPVDCQYSNSAANNVVSCIRARRGQQGASGPTAVGVH